LALPALLLGCESTKQQAISDPDARSPAEDAAVGSTADATNLPLPDAQTGPTLDAGLPASLDASVAADAGLDGNLVRRDAGAPGDAAVLPFVCNVPAPTACPTPPPRYPEIASIIKQRCASCHSPLWTGPWPLDSYGHVADWQDTIQANLLDCTMPPPEAGVPITVEERVSILTWIRCGLPQ
jgi:hypothetical protein